MAERTNIEWCDATLNLWWGCTKVSQGCKHCYAEHLSDQRYGKGCWGPTGTRQEVKTWRSTLNKISWQSGRFMPRWASRILLKVVGVKLERVQDITEEDARKEGVLHKVEFQKLWEKIHGAGAWARNDWVWAVEFEVVKP